MFTKFFPFLLTTTLLIGCSTDSTKAPKSSGNGYLAENNTKILSESEKTKIEILLKEYDTLRNEAVMRSGTNWAMLGFLIGILAIIFGRSGDSRKRVVIVSVVASVFLAALWWYQGHLMARCSIRIEQIEKKVNHIVDEDVLIWESKVSEGIRFRWLFCPGTLPEDSRYRPPCCTSCRPVQSR